MTIPNPVLVSSLQDLNLMIALNPLLVLSSQTSINTIKQTHNKHQTISTFLQQ